MSSRGPRASRLRIWAWRILIAAVSLVVVGAATAGALVAVGGGNLRTAGGSVAVDATDRITFEGQEYERDPDVVGIVLIGYDQRPEDASAGRAGQADAIVVAALNLRSGAVRFLQVPRDSMVAVDRYMGDTFLGQSTEQICLSFAYGDGREQSCERTLDAVSRVVNGVPLTYYIALNMAGIGPIADAVGGVELEPLVTIPDTDIVAGERRVLNGFDAEWYLRWRDLTQLDSAVMRQERQIQFLKALVSKLAGSARSFDVPTLSKVWSAAEPHVITNIGPAELSAVGAALAGGGFSADNLSVEVLSGSLQGEGRYAALYLDVDAVRRMTLDMFYRAL